MEVTELAKELEGRRWQQMIGILNKYSLELYTDALNQAQKAVESTWSKINKQENVSTLLRVEKPDTTEPLHYSKEPLIKINEQKS